MTKIRMIMILILLIGAISAIKCLPVREYNTLTIFDDAHFYPYSGVYMEPGGQYLSYSGSITIPFVYVLPSLTILEHSYCRGQETLLKMHKDVLEHIKSMVGTKSQQNRVKRSFFPIISVLAGGLGVWNTVEIQNIKSKLLTMSLQSIHVNEEISKLRDSNNLVIRQLGGLVALVGDQSRAINQLINATECFRRQENEFQLYISSWLYSAPSEFLSAYGGAVTGHVTPDLLSARNLNQVLLQHIDMKDTIYMSEPETVYEFGKVLLSEVVVDTHAHLKGVILLPKILALPPMPIYNIHTVNVYNQDLDLIYELPETLVCPTLKTCWDPLSNRCIRKSNRVICLYGTDSSPNLCIGGLQDNHTEACTIKVRKKGNPIVIQTQSGVLIGASKESYRVFRRVGPIDIPSFTIPPRDQSSMITPKEGDWVSIANNIYSTSISGFSYNFSVYISSQTMSTSIDPVKLSHKWLTIPEVSYTPLRFDNINSTDGLYILIICVNIVLALCVAYVLWVLKRKQKRKQKRALHLTHDAIGLR